METAWYQDWFNSSYYHKLYFERDEKEAAAFIGELIRYLRPEPASRMLDVACGRGRHSKILASMGYQVTGIDIAPRSIEEAIKTAPAGTEFFIHDMRLPFRSNYYQYAFNFFTSFGYFRTRREHDAAIRTIAASLKPGGCFVIDYLNVHYAENGLRHEEEKKVGATVYSIQRWDDSTHFHKRITISDPVLPHPYSYTEKVAKFNLGDFTEMLAYQGLQVQEIFGDYQLGHYDVQHSPRLIIQACKKH